MRYRVKPTGLIPGYVPWGTDAIVIEAAGAAGAARAWAERYARDKDVRVEVSEVPSTSVFVVRVDHGCSIVNEAP